METVDRTLALLINGGLAFEVVFDGDANTCPICRDSGEANPRAA